MPEIKKRIQPYYVDFRCEICGIGYFRPTGEVYTTYPMQYPHKCNACGAEMVVTGHTYPYIANEEEEEKQ